MVYILLSINDSMVVVVGYWLCRTVATVVVNLSSLLTSKDIKFVLNCTVSIVYCPLHM